MSRLRRLFAVAVTGAVANLPVALAVDPPAPTIPRAMPGDSVLPPPAVLAGPESCDPPATLGACLPSCAPHCRLHLPLCGPRMRIAAPAPATAPRLSCPTPVCDAGCGVPASPGFGTGPSRPSTIQPTMTTIQVPYTYMVPVPTFAMMPHTTVGFGAAPTAAIGQFGAVGFGAAPVAGFSFGGVQPAAATGFGAAPSGLSDAVLRNLLAAAAQGQSRDAGFGTAPAADDPCKKELAAVNVRIDKIRQDLDEIRVALAETKQIEKKVLPMILSALEDHAALLKGISAKIGEVPDGKTLMGTVSELGARLDKLKQVNKLK